MPTCEAHTRDGQPCRNRAMADNTLCGIHHRVRNVVRCRDCQHLVWRDGLCRFHHEIENAQQRQHAGEELWTELRYQWEHGGDIRDLELRLNEAYDLGDINRVWFRILGLRLAFLEIGVELGQEEPEEDPVAGDDLGAFARDTQSVHRAPVSEQTNRGLDILLGVAVSPEQKTMDEITAEWSARRHVRKVLRDMRMWYGRSMCREDGDWLYKRTLDGLWATIKGSEHREELTKRLYEEAKDARKMCCDGHITRLVNVMVGFDDRFNPPVPLSELVQQRMATIAGRDTSVEEKTLEAWIALEELKVPEGDRMAWIDAL